MSILSSLIARFKGGLTITRTGPSADAFAGNVFLGTRGAEGPYWSNSAVMACLGYVQDKIIEAPLLVMQSVDGDAEDKPIYRHAALDAIHKANGEYTGRELLQATALSLALDGNAYWLIGEGDFSQPKFTWIPFDRCEPKSSAFGGPLAYFRVEVDGKVPENVAPDRIVHFRLGIDPDNTLKGLSRFRAALNEVLTDAEATVYMLSMLKNPILGLMAAPKGDQVVGDEAALKALQKALQEKLTGGGRGRIFGTNMPMTFQEVGVTPEKMALREYRMTPEERICAVFRIPPVVVGLGAGLTRSTYNNIKEAREAAVESGVLPYWNLIGSVLTASVLPGFSKNDAEYICFNTSGIRELQEDEDKRVDRVRKNWSEGVILRSEARQALGYASKPEDDIYRTDIATAMAPDAAAKHLLGAISEASMARRIAFELEGTEE